MEALIVAVLVSSLLVGVKSGIGDEYCSKDEKFGEMRDCKTTEIFPPVIDRKGKILADLLILSAACTEISYS